MVILSIEYAVIATIARMERAGVSTLILYPAIVRDTVDNYLSKLSRLDIGFFCKDSDIVGFLNSYPKFFKRVSKSEYKVVYNTDIIHELSLLDFNHDLPSVLLILAYLE